MRSRLRKARELLSSEGAWTQRYCALNAHGQPLLSGTCHNAVSWCAMGALERVGEPLRGINIVAGLLDGYGIFAFNDALGRTQDEVLWMFDLAIAMEEVGE